MAVSSAVIWVLLVSFIGLVNGEKQELEACDIYNGRWVYDTSYSLYNSSQCPFTETPFDCQNNGRPDQHYLKYRWQPNACNLPRWDLITDGNGLHRDMDRLAAYETALSTWAQWVDKNIDFTKTKLFFQGISPTQMNAKFRGNYDGENCREETRPTFGPLYPRRRLPAEVIVGRAIGSMSKRVHLLNITRLSQQRKDAHPGRPGRHLDIGMDCTHWCLPGVPDTWNELLIAELTRS